MKNHPYLRLAGKILGTALVIAAVIFVLGYLLKWAPVQYSNGFFIAGAILIVMGVLSVASGFFQRADFHLVYTETAGDANLAERGQRMAEDITQRYGNMIFLLAAGGLLILISVGIGSYFLSV